MDGDFVLAVLSRWIHVGTAIVLVGGTTFMKLVVAPSLGGQATEVMTEIRRRWKKFVHGGIALLLFTGFFNYLYLGAAAHKGDKLYHPLIGIKILLAFVVFFLASALVGRSAGTQKFRDNSGKWMTVVVLLSALIVAISGFIKVRPLPGAVAPTEAGATAAPVVAE